MPERTKTIMRNRLVLVLASAFLFAGLYAGSGSHASEDNGLSLSVEVVEPVVLGHPFRMRGFVTNEADVARRIRVDQSDVTLVLEQEQKKNVRREIFDGYWKPVCWQSVTVVPPGKRVACFDCMVPTGLRWGTGCILARGKARILCQVWSEKGERFTHETVESKDFEIDLDHTDKKDFTVKGLQVEVRAAKQKVTSRDEVVLLVKLKNTSDKAIKLSGRERFDDNYCHFLIYGPGEQVPISEVVHWPTKGTKGIVIPSGKAIERKFRAAWGVRDVLVPGGPNGHVGHDRKETTFMKRGPHSILVYFHGEDNTTAKDGWTGYVRSNVIEVDFTRPEKN